MVRQGQAPPALDDLERQIAERDERDATRKDSPMVPASDARVVDTTSMTLEQVSDHLAGLIQLSLRESGR